MPLPKTGCPPVLRVASSRSASAKPSPIRLEARSETITAVPPGYPRSAGFQRFGGHPAGGDMHGSVPAQQLSYQVTHQPETPVTWSPVAITVL